VCHKGTTRTLARLAALALAAVVGVSAQTTEWRRVGNSSADVQLASPVTGRVNQVWYSDDGSLLYARTASGKLFQTLNFESWDPAAGDPTPPATFDRVPARTPDASATFVALRSDSAEMWGLGSQLFRSLDNGKSWDPLTAYRTQSVVGSGMHSVAVSPRDPDQIVVANDFGVWRSMDGGLTWAGLNQDLPNLSVERILATPSGAQGARIQTGDLGVLELPPGASVWQPAPALAAQATEELETRRLYGARVHADVTTFSTFTRGATQVVYAGTSDGQIFKSVDGGESFVPTQSPGLKGQTVERIFVDPALPGMALAALSGDGPRVLRIVSEGAVWDDISSNLPKTAAHSITADRSSGAVYVATDAGVYYTHAGLTDATTAESWNSVSSAVPSSALPAARVLDVRLDPRRVQLYVALEGYGVYGAPAPHRGRILRLLNAADNSARPAAPGSLLSVVGQRVDEATAGGLSYPVWNTAGTDSQIQVPFEAVGPTVALALHTAAGTVDRDLRVQPVSPAILVNRDGLPALFDADSGMPIGAGNAAHSGQRIQIMATGLGKVRPDWVTGRPAPAGNPPAVVAEVRTYLDRNPVSTNAATLAPGYVGFYLVEVQLPVVSNYGAMELHLSVDGQESNRVQIVIVP
jgi:uncharacterized protein (TIGR03437 family)